MELIWDECWRSTINYGRKGLPIQALSALDLALWDARPLGLAGSEVEEICGGAPTSLSRARYTVIPRPSRQVAPAFAPLHGNAGLHRRGLQQTAGFLDRCAR